MSNRTATLRSLRRAARRTQNMYEQIAMCSCFDYLMGRQEMIKTKFSNGDLFRPGNYSLATKLGKLNVRLVYRLFRSIGFDFPQVIDSDGVCRYSGLKKVVQTIRLASSLHSNGVVYRLAMVGAEIEQTLEPTTSSEEAIPLYETGHTKALRYGNCNNCSTHILADDPALNRSDDDMDSIDEEQLDTMRSNE